MQPGLFKASDDMQTVTKRKEEKEKKKKKKHYLLYLQDQVGSLHFIIPESIC
jgi:hypothetical protein